MNDPTMPGDEPLGSNDPWGRAIRLAYQSAPRVPTAAEQTAAVAAVWARLGWGAREPAAEPLTPEQVLDAFGPRYPARVLLGRADPLATSALEILVRREVESVLSLAQSLPAARITAWATDRLCGREPLPAGRRLFVTLVAEAVRDVWRASVERARGEAPTAVGHATLAELGRNVPLAAVALQESDAAVGLARHSQRLAVRQPGLGEVLLFSCYAGLPPAEVAALTGQEVRAVSEQLADASDWVRAQTV